MRKLFLKSMLLLCALIVGSSNLWATDPVTIASFTASTYHGGTTGDWSVTNASYATAGGGYYKLTYANCSITTPSINWSGYSNITITIAARTYGGPSDAQKVIYVKQGSTALTNYSPSGTSIASSSALSISPSGTGSLTIVCSDAGSDKGSGVQTITIKGEEVEASTVSAPSFSPAEGTYSVAQSVALSSSTVGASIYYTMTTDGSTPDDPTELSTLYSTAISVTTSGTIIKAKAFKSGMTASAVSTATYTISPTTPSFSAPAGRIAEGTDVTITVATGCVISYTTDGTDPSSSATATLTVGNSAVVNINEAKTIRAIALDIYANESAEAKAKYVAIDANEMEETMSKFTTTSGTLVNDITFTSYKGGGGTAPANYNNGIRLYQIGSGSYGGYIELSAPTGFSITGFSITSTNTYATTVNYTEDALYTTSFDGTNYSLAKSSDYAISGLDCSNVYIYNLGTGSSGRLEIGSISVFYTGSGKISISSDCTDGTMYYATYSNHNAFVVPSGITVSEVSVDGSMTITDYNTGDIVAANTGVLIASNTSGEKAITFTGKTGTDLGVTNMLHPGGVDADGMDAAAPGCKYYKLALKRDGEGYVANTAGFYWGADNGAAFASSANKAYLAVPTGGSSAPSHFMFNEEVNGATNIENIEASDKAVKFIENGRIFIKKNGIVYDALGRVIR